MEIEKPHVADIPELLELWRKQFEFHHQIDSTYFVEYSDELKRTFEWYLNKSIEAEELHILVARNEHGILGYTTFSEGAETYFDTNIKKFGQIVELYVAEHARAQGVGKALVDAAEKFFAAKGLSHVKLCASVFNTNAREFYKHLGYVETEIALFKKL